ncbi:hypothetical protein Dda_8171 [Drechslerella dactyloides]|uniref:Extracellular membrane protein CFEM domain-containing protein n=1 Tax=Drechslerella dactyloides TaxID=74499 RepID=A0AAD6IRX2_DREDA|nr:hypothetical protein Dda_8171 [Drechslerella dactyloides]
MRHFLLPVILLTWILQVAASPVPSPGQSSYYSPKPSGDLFGNKAQVVADAVKPYVEEGCVDNCVLRTDYNPCTGSEGCRENCEKFIYRLWNAIDRCIQSECSSTATSYGMNEARDAKAFANVYCTITETLLPLIGEDSEGPSY